MTRAIPQPFPPVYPPKEELIPPKTVMYLDPDNSSGSKIIDGSGMGNHCTLNNGPVKKSKPYGNSFYFDGVDDYGEIPYSNSLDITTAPLTLLAWASIPQENTSRYLIAHNTAANDSSTVQYGLLWEDSTNTYNIVLEGLKRNNTNQVENVTNFNFPAFSWNGSTIQPYLNGKKNGTSSGYSGTLSRRSSPVEIARRLTNGGLFKGNIGEIWIIQDALKPAQIRALFEETAWKYGVKI